MRSINNSNLISVIVPCYNSEKYILQCIDSIISQTYNNIEIIIVNDGSTDNTLMKIRKLMKLVNCDKRIKVIDKKNGGANSARKAGMNIATGNYVCFMDSDDFLDLHYLEEMTICLEKYNADIVTCGEVKVFEDGKQYRIPLGLNGLYDGIEVGANILNLDMFYTYNIGTSLHPHVMKRSLIEKYLFEIDEEIYFSEDAISWLAFMDAKKVYVSDKYLYFYRIHDGSISHTHKISNYYCQKILYNFMLKNYKEKKLEALVYGQLEQLIVRDLILGGYDEAFGYSDELYPYDGVKVGSKIVIYGAGAMGQEIVRSVLKRKKFDLVAWVDSAYNSMNFEYFDVTSPENIDGENFDFVVIAVALYETRHSIIDYLKRKNIDKNKIKDIDISKIKYNYINGFIEW